MQPPDHAQLGPAQPDLTQLDLAPRHLAILLPLLERHVPEAEVWAFGSRVTGCAHEGSDLDLVLRNPALPAVPAAGMAGLRLALKESMLPFSVDVHDWARLPEAFRRNMERCHVVVRAAA